MSDISFNQIPLDILNPGVYVEIDPTLAFNGLPVFKQRTVMFGQMGAGAEAKAGELHKVVSASEAVTLFGRASMLRSMVERFRAINPYQELLVVPLAEKAAGRAAKGKITFSGAPTRGFTQRIYVAGKHYDLSVSSGEDASTLADRLRTLIGNDPDAIVTPSGSGAEVILTCKWKGESGNDISLFTRYYSDDGLSPGLSLTLSAFAGGSGNPDIQAGLDALDDLTQYQGFVMPWSDLANIRKMRTELDARWSPLQQLDGRCFVARRASVSDLSAYAASVNSHNIWVMDAHESSASPSWDWAAAFGANVMYYGALDPARPFQNLVLTGLMGAPEGSRRKAAQNETLLRDGISTHKIHDDGRVVINRVVTSYQQNAAGADDTAWRSGNTVMIMSYYRRLVINRFELKYPRHKLASAGHPAAGRSGNLIDPDTAKAEFIALYKDLVEQAGLMDDFEGYKQDIIAQKRSNVRGRLDVFDRPRPIDQFHQLAVRSAFKLI